MSTENDQTTDAEKTPNRPTAAGRWVVRVLGGEEQIMNVIDIDENRERLFAVNENRLVRSIEWFSEVGGVEWVRPEAFPVSPSAMNEAETRAAVAEKKLGLAKACLQDISEGKWKNSARRTAKAAVDLMEWFGEPMDFVVSMVKSPNERT